MSSLDDWERWLWAKECMYSDDASEEDENKVVEDGWIGGYRGQMDKATY